MPRLKVLQMDIANLYKNPDMALPSIAAAYYLEETETQATKAESIVSAASCPECGNGNVGPGFPGERQVNDPAQDPPLFPHITQSETSIARFGTYVLFGFNDSNGINTDNPNLSNVSGVAFSSDSGVTWCDCGNLPKGDFQELGGDPVIATDSNGIFYYGSLATDNTGASVISVSTGEVNAVTKVLTMNDPTTVGVGEAAGRFQDKEWIAVGTDKNNPGNQALYTTWTDFGDTSNTIRFSKFTTGANPAQIIGSTTIVFAVPNEFTVQGSFPVIDSAGNIYVFYEFFDPNIPNSSNRSIRMVRSTDGGVTFNSNNPIIVASPVTAASTSTAGCNRPSILVEEIPDPPPTRRRAIRMNEAPHAAVAPDGTLYVVWNDGKNLATTGIDIYLTYSTDGGDNWTQIPVTDTATHEFFPSVIFNCSKAQIQYSRFNDPNNVGGVGDKTFALFKKSFTIAGGLSPETMVSTVFSPVPITQPNFDTGISNCYMGDYNQIIAGPGGTLYHAWGDNRFMLEGANNPDVFFIQTNCEEIPPGRGVDFTKLV